MIQTISILLACMWYKIRLHICEIKHDTNRIQTICQKLNFCKQQSYSYTEFLRGNGLSPTTRRFHFYSYQNYG